MEQANSGKTRCFDFRDPFCRDAHIGETKSPYEN